LISYYVTLKLKANEDMMMYGAGDDYDEYDQEDDNQPA
jgi:hypothetical protein